MKNFLNSVKVFKPRSNLFDLSHDVKLSGNMGELIPILAMDCVPGDHVNLSCESLIRLAPMVAPMMHRVDVTMHYFFVPNRLLWRNWKNFVTNTEVSGSIPAFPYLQYATADYANYPLLDYMGLPDPGANTMTVSALPFAAYQLIYDEYYRDQNMTAENAALPLADGNNGSSFVALTALKRRAWEHDYFTAALPFAQKGDAVEIPISGDVVLKTATGTGEFKKSDGTDYAGVGIGNIQFQEGTSQTLLDGSSGITTGKYDPNGTLEVQNADTTINDLRRATALQKFLEKLARGGSRLTEYIRTIFGVTSSDARLQRPEYITGIKAPVVISEVLNTTGTVDAPQGNMAGHGASVTSGKYGSFFCEEHGYIIGIMSVMPRTAYQQGVPKHFTKINDTYEYFTPDFANIGEQEILNKEVYAPHATPDSVFGYIPRYGEYKFMQNRVAGDFKTTLNFWHMGRIFTSDPALNETFIQCNPTHRVFAVTDPTEHKLWCHVYNKITARRLMPKYGTPTF